MLVVYDEHGGIFDHVPPPACTPDGFVAQPSATGTPDAFHFDRLGVRVPAILISPWVQRGSVINDVYEHASIPGDGYGVPHRRLWQPFTAGDCRQYISRNTSICPPMRADSDCPTFNLA